MAQRSRAKFEKRQKELARQDKQKAKRDRRLEVKERGAGEEDATADPDAPQGEVDPAAPPEEA